MSTISQEVNEPFCDCSNFYANLNTTMKCAPATWHCVYCGRDVKCLSVASAAPLYSAFRAERFVYRIKYRDLWSFAVFAVATNVLIILSQWYWLNSFDVMLTLIYTFIPFIHHLYGSFISDEFRPNQLLFLYLDPSIPCWNRADKKWERDWFFSYTGPTDRHTNEVTIKFFMCLKWLEI